MGQKRLTLKYSSLLLIMAFAAVLALPAAILSQADDMRNTVVDHLPGNVTGPIGNVDTSYKFDDGFYDKIQDMINTEPQYGAPNVYDGKIYHDVIFVVSRDDGDDRNPDQVAAENKDALVKMLNNTNALNIKPAEALSFVTASVPVIALPGLSLYDEVFGIGDGALEAVSDINMARSTIHATSEELRTSSGIFLNGSGVVVGVLDSGINHPSALNHKIIEHVSCNSKVCRSVNDVSAISDINPNDIRQPPADTTHGTRVAQVLAASMLLPVHNGISPGVHLLDVEVIDSLALNAGNDTARSSVVARGLDWALKNGADVVNLSLSIDTCAISDLDTNNLILNEAVDKGMIAVKSAGNRGWDRTNSEVSYNSIGGPGCAHNTITVGAINDRNSDNVTMLVNSSRGPVTDATPRLKPDLVAPGVNIETLTYINNANATNPTTGTSVATPQVSATAALLLQAKPDLTPVEIKAAVLLGANWQAPIPCNSPQFEANNANDNCSHVVQPSDIPTSSHATSLTILNNVGFGILNVNQTLEYVSERTPTHNHIMGDYLDADTNSKQYTFRVTDTSEPVKVILTWFVHPHGGITEQVTRNKIVNVADLGFTIRTPTGQTINADSKYQTNEFAVFNPTSTGTYTVTVTGLNLDSINKPVQNYALASTHSLTLLPAPFLNRAPVMQSDTIIINPTLKESAIIRLTGTDQNNDSISFSVSKDPLYGTVSTDEQITKTSSRLFYNASSSFGTLDTFEVTPQDGLVAGRPATIIIRAESLPSGANGNAAPDSSLVKKWDTLEVKHGYAHSKYSATFSGPDYPISAIYLGSANMEGVDAQITSTSGVTYTAAIPPSGDRMITLASPLSIRSVVLSADGLDEESAYDNNKDRKPAPRKSAIHSAFIYDDVRMFVGYVPTSCTGNALSGAQGSSSLCPAYTTYQASSNPSFAIPDNTRIQDTSDTMLVPVNGTLRSVSVSVDISHTYPGDLKVELSSPAGKTITLHDKTGGGSDDIKKTYDSTTTLSSLLGSATAGNWTLTIGDYASGDVGTLNSWSVSAQYEPVPVDIITNNDTTDNASVTIFSDNFESGTLTKWTETGEGDWIISTSKSHSAPTLPGRSSINMVLHSDDCDTSCTVTTQSALDLSGYAAATLSFWRFIDYGFDRDEYLKVEISDGSSWKTVFHWSPNINRGDDNKWHNESYDMTEYAGKSSVSIRFVTQQSATSEDVQIDDVVVNATTGTKKPNQNTTGSVTPLSSTEYSVYVADTDDYEILVYSSTGTYQDDIVPSKSGGLGKPYDVAFGPDDHLYVSDNTYSKIRKYDGSTGAPLGKTAASAEWSSTRGIPNGMVWNGNVLYVATLFGIEKISSSGANLGYFGDASKAPSSAGIPKLVSPYDVAFCPDGKMYVADRSLDRILYYDGSTGKYKGTVSNMPESTQPDMDEASGLECGPAIAGNTGSISLFQSGEDRGWINEINYSTKKLVRQFTMLVDEPFGMDSDSTGNLYVANKDDNNILKISQSGTTSVFATGKIDDPRGVIVGPKYITPSNSGDAVITPLQNNDGPEIMLQNGTTPIQQRMVIAADSSLTLGIVAVDPEGDAVTLDILPYAIPSTAVSITDYENGTGTISINTSDMALDTYAFMVTAYDGQNLERVINTVVVQ